MPEIKKVRLVVDTAEESTTLYFDRVEISSVNYDEHGSAGYNILEDVGKKAAKAFECKFEYDEI